MQSRTGPDLEVYLVFSFILKGMHLLFLFFFLLVSLLDLKVIFKVKKIFSQPFMRPLTTLCFMLNNKYLAGFQGWQKYICLSKMKNYFGKIRSTDSTFYVKKSDIFNHRFCAKQISYHINNLKIIKPFQLHHVNAGNDAK